MTDRTKKAREDSFMKRNETLRGLYDADVGTLSSEEKESLTPILNDLKKNKPRYDQVEPIATGGEKQISMVHDNRLDRRVAMAKAAHASRKESFEQFLREARLTANLTHPNIIPVFNMGLDSKDEPFFSMELVQGDSLKDIIHKLREGDPAYRRDYPLDVLLNIYLKVCDAVAYAHSRNVLHLDLKPDNIKVGEFGKVFVCDWGLARVQNEEYEESADDPSVLDADVLNDMTLSGTMKGTPGFMAPEQTEAYGKKTPQTDIYAMGAMLYMLLTYKLPVAGVSANEVIQNTREGKIIPLRRTDSSVPRGLAAVALKALSLQPYKRYPSVVALQAEISRYLSGYPTEAESAGWFTRVSLLLQRHSRLAILIIFFLVLLASVISANLVVISREKSDAVKAREAALAAQTEAEGYLERAREQELMAKEAGRGIGAAVAYTVRSTVYMMPDNMIAVLESGLSETHELEKRKEVLAQIGRLYFVKQAFRTANKYMEAAGKHPYINSLRPISKRYGEIKQDDEALLPDRQLARLIKEAGPKDLTTLYYLYHHHMIRRPDDTPPEDYLPLASAMLDKLNYRRYSEQKPLKLTRLEDGTYHLDLAGAPYWTFTISLGGTYRRNVLKPLNLSSIDLSNSAINSLKSLQGIQLKSVRIHGVRYAYRKWVGDHARDLGLERIILDEKKYPAETIAKMRETMEVIDSGKKK